MLASPLLVALAALSGSEAAPREATDSAVVHSTAEAEASLSLENAIALALRNNERAGVADADMDIAFADVRKARSRFFPTLDATGAYNRRMYQIVAQNPNGGPPVVLRRYDALSGVARLRANLFDARAIPLYRGALRSQEAVVFSAAETKRLLAFDTAAQFFAVLSHEQVRDAAQRRVAYATQSFKDAEARLAAQLVGSNDVTRAQLELAVAQADQTDAQGNVEVQYQELGFLIAQPVASPLQSPNALFEEAAAATPEPGFSLTPSATTRRLDLRSLRKQVEAARQLALEPRLRVVPSLQLAGDLITSNEPGYGGHQVDGFVGLVLNWQLYDGGLRYADAAQFDARLARTQLETHMLTRRVGTEVEIARINLLKMQASLKQAQTAAGAADRNAQESLALYRKGLVNQLSVEDANTRLFEANVTLARQRYELALAYLHLRAALGLDPLGREPVVEHG